MSFSVCTHWWTSWAILSRNLSTSLFTSWYATRASLAHCESGHCLRMVWNLLERIAVIFCKVSSMIDMKRFLYLSSCCHSDFLRLMPRLSYNKQGHSEVVLSYSQRTLRLRELAVIYLLRWIFWVSVHFLHPLVLVGSQRSGQKKEKPQYLLLQMADKPGD